MALSMGLYEFNRRRMGLGTDVLRQREEIRHIERAKIALRPADWQRPVRTLSSQILWLCLTLSGLPMSFLPGRMAVGAVKTGRFYWTSRYTGHGGDIYATTHPEAFWIIVGLWSVFSTMILVSTVTLLCQLAREEKRRQSTFAGKCALWGSGLVYLGIVGSVAWYLAA
jgi:hypothetical protein